MVAVRFGPFAFPLFPLFLAFLAFFLLFAPPQVLEFPAGGGQFRRRFGHSRPTQFLEALTSSLCRKSRIGKKFGSRARLFSS